MFKKLFEKQLNLLIFGGDYAMHSLIKHSHNVVMLCKKLAKELGLNQQDIKLLVTAAEYHDIGKKVLSGKILFKRGKFSSSEYELIKSHPLKGAEILKILKMDERIVLAVKHHHEWWNGKGYPDGLEGFEVPLFSRIIAISDSYDVMISGRAYQKAVKPIIALTEILKDSGTQFDPGLVKIFLNCQRKDDSVCLK